METTLVMSSAILPQARRSTSVVFWPAGCAVVNACFGQMNRRAQGARILL